MILRMVTACTNPQGEPDFHFCKVQCDEEQYVDGEHYLAARERAASDGYGGEMVVFDEEDGPCWLFCRFVWESATLVKI